MGAEISYIVPNRFEYGYGLTPEIVALAAQESPKTSLPSTMGLPVSTGGGGAR